MSSRDDVRKAVDSAVASVLARLKSDLVDQVVTSLPEPPPPPPPPPAPAPAGGPDLGPLRDEVFSLMDGNGQVEILTRLMDHIASWWERAVLFLVKPGVYQPWDARGFDGGAGNAAVKAVTIAEHADTLLDAALAGSGAQAGNHLLESKLGPHHGACAAVPLGIRNKAAAILYVDGPKADRATAVSALEILARAGALSIEMGMLSKRTPPFVRHEAVLGSAAAAPAPAPAVAFAVPLEAEPEIEVEMEAPAPMPTFTAPAPPAPPAPAPAAVPTFSMPPAARVAPPPAPAAVPTFSMPPAAPAPAPAPPAPTFSMPPAAPAPAPAPPAPTFSMPPAAAPPAPAPAPPAAAPAPPTGDHHEGGTLDPRELLKGGAKPVVDAGQAMPTTKVASRWKPVRDQMKGGEDADPALANVPEAERHKHAEARKFARVLVAELKLYNPAKVAVGIKNKDLYERLKDDIERSRSSYNDKVAPDVASKTNYFWDELVATLAEGDASALGPGAK